MSRLLPVFAALALGFAALVTSAATASTAKADSYWDHNGSLMRLSARGNQRFFYYQAPRDGMRRAGVSPGTLLFNGVKDGLSYRGTARVFSRHCNAPLEYFVEGPVAPDSAWIRLYGQREVYGAGCVPTGRYVTDELIFNYRYSD